MGHNHPVRATRYVVVDAETDGPVVPDYSMVCFGAVVVEEPLTRTFYGRVRPVSAQYVPDTLAISGFTREQHEAFPPPTETMTLFADWLDRLGARPVFISDNLAFDWAAMNWYLHHFVGQNPFGWSGRRIGDIYGGFKRDLRERWKWLRRTPHTHHPVDDAMGNAEALLAIAKMGVKGIV